MTKSIGRIFDIFSPKTLLENMAFIAGWHLRVAAGSAHIVLTLSTSIKSKFLIYLVKVDSMAALVTHRSTTVRASISTKTFDQSMVVPTV